MRKFLITITMFVTLLTPAVALAAPPPSTSPADSAKSQVCQGVSSNITGSDCNGATAQASLEKIMATVLDILSWVAGIAAVIMVVIAGLKYITSGGDSSSISTAKTSLIYAIVGVIVVAIAQTIVRFAIHVGKSGQ